MYDAINKGIKMATGDVVGILNADDVLASDDTLAHIASAFEPPEVGSLKSEVDCVYADIRFVKRRDAASPSQGGASPSDESLSCKGDEEARFVKRRDAPRIEPPSALASLGLSGN